MSSRAPSSTSLEESVTRRPWLHLCWRVVRHRLTALYDDASRLVAVHGVDPLTLPDPLERYRLHAVRALLLEHAGRTDEARAEARAALAVKGLERDAAAPAVRPSTGSARTDAQARLHAPDADADVDARLVAMAG